jgi:hypothetical protein
MSVTGRREERILEIIETARSKRGKFRAERVDMSTAPAARPPRA